MNDETILFEIFENTDSLVGFELDNGDGTPVDLTGCTMFVTAKRKIDDADEDAILKKTWTTHTDAANGKTEVEFARAEVTTAGKFMAEIALKDAGGKMRPPKRGFVVINKRLTQRTS